MKKWIIVILIFVCGFTSYAEEEPEQLYAQSAVLMDADSGRVLFAKNGTEIKAMASTTKIMTCILALEYGDLEKEVIFSQNAASQPKVHLGAAEGERFYLKELLYSLMLESHNDTAVAVAEAVAGSVEAFAKKMNQKAEEIGCSDTYFITPNGLDASDEVGVHATTAVDLAKIMSYCIKKSPQKEQFLKITGTEQYQFSNLDKSKSYTCTNHNTFLDMMEEAVSGKTGFTSKAGYCYVGAVESKGRTYVVSLLACGWPNNKNYKWSDMKKIVNYGMEAYHFRTVEKFPDTKKIEVINGIPETGDLFGEAETETTIIGNLDEICVLAKREEKIEYIIEQDDKIEAPIKAGTKVGEVVYFLGEKELASFPIVTENSIQVKTFTWYFEKILKQYSLNI